jgi:hypothetical protein
MQNVILTVINDIANRVTDSAGWKFVRTRTTHLILEQVETATMSQGTLARSVSVLQNNDKEIVTVVLDFYNRETSDLSLSTEVLY